MDPIDAAEAFSQTLEPLPPTVRGWVYANDRLIGTLSESPEFSVMDWFVAISEAEHVQAVDATFENEVRLR